MQNSTNMNPGESSPPNDRRLNCNFCNKVFKSHNYVKVHEAWHRGELKHKCNTCQRYFRFPSELKKHISIHTGEKPYKCDRCGECFNKVSALNLHMKTDHVGMKEEPKFSLEDPNKIHQLTINLPHDNQAEVDKKKYDAMVSKYENMQQQISMLQEQISTGQISPPQISPGQINNQQEISFNVMKQRMGSGGPISPSQISPLGENGFNQTYASSPSPVSPVPMLGGMENYDDFYGGVFNGSSQPVNIKAESIENDVDKIWHSEVKYSQILNNPVYQTQPLTFDNSSPSMEINLQSDSLPLPSLQSYLQPQEDVHFYQQEMAKVYGQDMAAFQPNFNNFQTQQNSPPALQSSPENPNSPQPTLGSPINPDQRSPQSKSQADLRQSPKNFQSLQPNFSSLQPDQSVLQPNFSSLHPNISLMQPSISPLQSVSNTTSDIYQQSDFNQHYKGLPMKMEQNTKGVSPVFEEPITTVNINDALNNPPHQWGLSNFVFVDESGQQQVFQVSPQRDSVIAKTSRPSPPMPGKKPTRKRAVITDDDWKPDPTLPLGWKIRIHERQTTRVSGRKQQDVYFKAPNGKRILSRGAVENYLIENGAPQSDIDLVRSGFNNHKSKILRKKVQPALANQNSSSQQYGSRFEPVGNPLPSMQIDDKASLHEFLNFGPQALVSTQTSLPEVPLDLGMGMPQLDMIESLDLGVPSQPAGLNQIEINGALDLGMNDNNTGVVDLGIGGIIPQISLASPSYSVHDIQIHNTSAQMPSSSFIPVPSPSMSVHSPPMSINSTYSTSPPQISITSPQMSSNSPYISTSPPQISITSPQMSTTSPQMSITSPSYSVPDMQIHNTSSFMPVPSPSISVHSPPMSTNSQYISTTSPQMSINSPYISTTSPQMSSSPPQMSITSPLMSTASIQMSSNSPEGLSSSPLHIPTTSPHMSSHSPPIPDTYPHIYITENPSHMAEHSYQMAPPSSHHSPEMPDQFIPSSSHHSSEMPDLSPHIYTSSMDQMYSASQLSSGFPPISDVLPQLHLSPPSASQDLSLSAYFPGYQASGWMSDPSSGNAISFPVTDPLRMTEAGQLDHNWMKLETNPFQGFEYARRDSDLFSNVDTSEFEDENARELPLRDGFGVSTVTKIISEKIWLDDKSVPDGWKVSVEPCVLFGKVKNKTSFLSPTGQFFSTRKTAVDFMKQSGAFSADHINQMQKDLDKKNKNVWCDTEEKLPHGWRVSELLNTTNFQLPGGQVLRGRHSALVHMIKNVNSYTQDEIDSMRMSLTKEGWNEDKNLPFLWRYKTFVTKYEAVKKTVCMFISPKGVVFRSKKKIRLNDDPSLELSSEDKAKIQAFQPDLPDQPPTEILDPGDDWEYDPQCLPKGWRKKQFQFQCKKLGRMKKYCNYLSPDNLAFRSKKAVLEYMEAKGTYSEEDKEKFLLIVKKTGVIRTTSRSTEASWILGDPTLPAGWKIRTNPWGKNKEKGRQTFRSPCGQFFMSRRSVMAFMEEKGTYGPEEFNIVRGGLKFKRKEKIDNGEDDEWKFGDPTLPDGWRIKEHIWSSQVRQSFLSPCGESFNSRKGVMGFMTEQGTYTEADFDKVKSGLKFVRKDTLEACKNEPELVPIGDWQEEDATVPPGWKVKNNYWGGKVKQTFLSPDGQKFTSRKGVMDFMKENCYPGEDFEAVKSGLKYTGRPRGDDKVISGSKKTFLTIRPGQNNTDVQNYASQKMESEIVTDQSSTKSSAIQVSNGFGNSFRAENIVKIENTADLEERVIQSSAKQVSTHLSAKEKIVSDQNNIHIFEENLIENKENIFLNKENNCVNISKTYGKRPRLEEIGLEANVNAKKVKLEYRGKLS